jgi:hypothetical protein
MKIAIILSVLALAAQAHAQTAVVLPPSGINVDAETLDAVQDVLRGHLETAGHFQVLVVAAPGGRYEPTPDTAAAAARAASADFAVAVHLTRLGRTTQVRVTGYTAGGALFYVDQMSAGSPDDVDRVLARLAKGLATGRAGKETADLDTVTEKEATPALRKAVTHTFGVGIGTVVPFTGDAAPIPGLAIYWLYDARSFLADVTLQFHSKDSRSDFSAGIGAYVPMLDADLTPYAGGGLRYAHTDYLDNSNGASGVQLFVAAGLLQGRASSLQLRVQLEVFCDTFTQNSTMDVYDYQTTGWNTTTVDSVLGSGVALNFSLGF